MVNPWLRLVPSSLELFADNARCLVVRKSFPGLQDLEAEFRELFTAVYGTDIKFDGQNTLYLPQWCDSAARPERKRTQTLPKYQGKSFSLSPLMKRDSMQNETS